MLVVSKSCFKEPRSALYCILRPAAVHTLTTGTHKSGPAVSQRLTEEFVSQNMQKFVAGVVLTD